ncbi:MAG: hypothetical protein KatS3mg061_3139 [Dehalococcoidia bacterium]|nr:MAG: hypothetical protein KatS3mg061_3139 [Dehalococcoidia bacterium]
MVRFRFYPGQGRNEQLPLGDGGHFLQLVLNLSLASREHEGINHGVAPARRTRFGKASCHKHRLVVGRPYIEAELLAERLTHALTVGCHRDRYVRNDRRSWSAGAGGPTLEGRPGDVAEVRCGRDPADRAIRDFAREGEGPLTEGGYHHGHRRRLCQARGSPGSGAP